MDPEMKSFNPNRHLKEEFVSNLTGSSMFELFALFTMVPVVMVVRHSICFNWRIGNWKVHTVTIAVEFLFVVLPIILLLTVLADWTYYTCAILLMLVLFLFVSSKRYSVSLEDGTHSLRTYITLYRVLMMLVTCLSILAVDFNVFPRRFAKVETYGTSLMDLGVGSFVLANALVSRQARGISTMSLRNALKSTSPLLFLGFARLVFTSGVDYQVHVGEYGVHWNFFFTLAAVSILTSIFDLSPSYCGVLGLSVLVGYQLCLMCGLNVYLLSNRRGTDIISQNKEGIFSIFGYWGMHLVGVHLGSYLFFGNHLNPTLRTNRWTRIRVWILSLVFWLLTLFLDCYVEKVSRRMCNLAYVTIVLAANLQVLAIIMLSGYMRGDKITKLEEAFDKNLLGLFLLGNVLTGLVNLSIDTLNVSSTSAVSILIVYSLILSLAAGLTSFFGIKFKFW